MGRTDVTALPSGPRVLSICTVTFLVILPIFVAAEAADFALQIAFVRCLIGAFLGDLIPVAVLLSCLAGLGLVLLAMNPMLPAGEGLTVALAVLALIFINWFGKKPVLPKILTGFLVLAVGTGQAWSLGQQSPEAEQQSRAAFDFKPPTLHVDSFRHGIPHALPCLALAVPLGLANYVFDLATIQSARAAGALYPNRPVVRANGYFSIIGPMFGLNYDLNQCEAAASPVAKPTPASADREGEKTG